MGRDEIQDEIEEVANKIRNEIVRTLGAGDYLAGARDYSHVHEVWVNLVARPSEINPYSLALLLVNALKIKGDVGGWKYAPRTIVINSIVPRVADVVDKNENELVELFYKLLRKRRKNLVGVCYRMDSIWRSSLCHSILRNF